MLGLLLTESRADEEAASLVGKAMLQLETVPAGQWTGLVLRAAVSLALWSGDTRRRSAIAEREWPRALESDELAVVAWAASTCLEAAAAAADRGRETSDAGLIVRARGSGRRGPAQGDRARGALVDRPAARCAPGGRAVRWPRRAPTRGASAAASDAATWGRLAEAWGRRAMPYLEAKARWWQALAILAAAEEDDREAARLAAREPLAEAYRIARRLPALPLLREIVDLAARARVALPVMDVGRPIQPARGRPVPG